MNNNATSAIKTDGTLWMWGTNYKGVLGHNNEVKYSSPTQVPGTWVGVTRGHNWSGFIKDPTA